MTVPLFQRFPPQTPRKSVWRRRIAPETTHTPRSSCRSPPSCGSSLRLRQRAGVGREYGCRDSAPRRELLAGRRCRRLHLRCVRLLSMARSGGSDATRVQSLSCMRSDHKCQAHAALRASPAPARQPASRVLATDTHTHTQHIYNPKKHQPPGRETHDPPLPARRFLSQDAPRARRCMARLMSPSDRRSRKPPARARSRWPCSLPSTRTSTVT